MREYEKIHRNFEKCQLRKYLLDDFMDGSERSHWNWDSGDRESEDDSF